MGQSPIVHAAHTRCTRSGKPHPRRIAQRNDPSNTRLVVAPMVDRTAFYFTQGLAASSIKTYQSGVNRYLKFCQSKFSPLRVSQYILCEFVSQLADEGLKHRSVKTYLQAFVIIKCVLATMTLSRERRCRG